MPSNKNAHIRYRALDNCFRNTGRRYFIDDLIEACNNALLEDNPNSSGVSKRTVQADISFLKTEQGGSIELTELFVGKRKYFRYLDPSFSLFDQSLNESEAKRMRAALQILSRFSGLPQFEWVSEVIPMMESKFGLVEQKNEIINFEGNVDLRGLDFLTPLFNAIVNEQVLRVTYQDFQSPEPYQLLFHPYYLKQYNGRWFAFGLNPAEGVPNWNLALDRIQGIEDTTLDYQASNMDWEAYFYDIIGVTRMVDGEVEKVALKFTPSVAPYISTKPIHPTQRAQKEQDGSLKVTIDVIPNFELTKLLLSFGEQVEILGPEHLKDKIFDRLHAAVRQYQ